jgi:hypothetical protein
MPLCRPMGGIPLGGLAASAGGGLICGVPGGGPTGIGAESMKVGAGAIGPAPMPWGGGAMGPGPLGLMPGGGPIGLDAIAGGGPIGPGPIPDGGAFGPESMPGGGVPIGPRTKFRR